MCPGSAMVQFITVEHCIEHCGLYQVIMFSYRNLYSYFHYRSLATQPEGSLTRETWHYAWAVYSDSWKICALLWGMRSGCQRDRRGLNKQVTGSTDNVTMLYSTVHVLRWVHPNCLIGDAANSTDRICDVLLTLHLSIFTLVINPLNTELNPICQ